MADSDAWTTIESDPGVFTELITEMGVNGVQVEELYSLDKGSLQDLQPIYGLVFLFKWQQEKDDRPCMPFEEYHGKVFFAKQVITNACATQALLSILLNRSDLQLGQELTDLRSFTADFSPELLGHAISNSDSIRKAHNSFRPPNPMMSEERAEASTSDEVYHFIAYLPVQGVLYELDGLKTGPIKLCDCSKENWLDDVQPFIQQRIERYSASEIRFNLMALIRDRRAVLTDQLETLSQQIKELQASPADAQGQLPHLVQSAADCKERLDREHQRYRIWHDDNVRRRTNYIPFIFNLLRILAEEGRLQPLLEKARLPKEKSKS